MSFAFETLKHNLRQLPDDNIVDSPGWLVVETRGTSVASLRKFRETAFKAR